MRDRRQMRAVSSLLFSILVVLMLVLGFSSTFSLQPALQPAQPPGYPSTLGSFGTATVDGVLSPGEYGSCIGPITLPQSLAGTQYTIIFCETNDGTNDYYYFQINDLAIHYNDSFFLLFDNNNDDLIPACVAGREDAITFLASRTPPIVDEHYCGPPPASAPDPIQNLVKAFSFTPGVGYRFEFSHPLNSGDSLDYALSIGSTVGWCIVWRDGDKPPPNILDYPPECYYKFRATGQADLYGHVIKLGNQTICPTVTTTVTTTITTTTTRPTTVTTTTTSVTTSTTTATTTTTQLSTTTSATTITTTSIVIDPMLELKLDILIGLVITIIILVIWLLLKCCKKKVALEPPLTPSPPPEPPPPQPPQPSSGKPPP
ncbi:MAG: hypothetical protein QXH12_08160 [Candidatus Caldarchaeum sp.]